MPALSALIPNGDGSNGPNGWESVVRPFGSVNWSLIDGDPATATGSEYVETKRSFQAPTNKLAQFFVDLSNTPIDFGSMTSLDLDIAWRLATFEAKIGRIWGQVYSADESITLTNEVHATTATILAKIRNVLSFGVIIPGNKSLWDSARLRITMWSQDSSGSVELWAARLTNGVYETASESYRHLSLLGVG